MTGKLNLEGFAQWVGKENLEMVDAERRRRGEYKRKRDLTTESTLLLMIMVASFSNAGGLEEIIRMAASAIDTGWSVTVTAFCDARARFSPRLPPHALRAACGGVGEAVARRSEALARAPPGRLRQDHAATA
jgi:hypothetical protein